MPFGPLSALGRLACPALAGDLGALGAGAPHFATQLDPWFKTVTEERLAGKSPAEAVTVACSIRHQHEALFSNAVAPGFDQVNRVGYMSDVGTTSAKKVVPLGAALFRDRNLIEILDQLYGSDVAEDIYAAYVATCGSGRVIDDLPNMDIGLGDVVRFPIRPGAFVGGTIVDLVFTSEPRHAGQATVAADGSLNVEVSVPEALAPGEHVLHVQGTGAAGLVEVRRALRIASDVPLVQEGAAADNRTDQGGGGGSAGWLLVPAALGAAGLSAFVWRRRRTKAAAV